MAGPYAIRGTLYVGSITNVNGVTGTLLKGLEEGEVEIRPNISNIEKRIPNARLDPIGTVLGDVSLSVILRLRGHDTDTVNRVLGWLASSGAMSTNNATVGAAAPTTALVVRPASTGEKFFYTPSITLLRTGGLRLLFSQTAPVFEDSEVEFLCGIAIGSPTEPAAVWDSAANIASAYAGLSET